MFDKSRKVKSLILRMDGGMVPFRMFVERSRSSNVDISWPVFRGIAPERKLLLKEGFLKFDQSGVDLQNG